MVLDAEPVSCSGLGSLQSCLVDGDPAQRKREGRTRRKAFISSVLLQAGFLAALILVPLFAKPAHLVTAVITPIPPYRHASAANRDHVQHPQGDHRRLCVVCFNPRPTTRSQVPITSTNEPPEPTGASEGSPVPCPGCSNIGRNEGPMPPVPAEPKKEKPRLVHTQISPAMLIHRVEPVYPILPKQLGRSGRVELRAVIATDGTIQSLQIVSGDPLFYQSAMDAVRQWRYRPTVLNGEPVEIDTFISVIYNIDR